MSLVVNADGILETHTQTKSLKCLISYDHTKNGSALSFLLMRRKEDKGLRQIIELIFSFLNATWFANTWPMRSSWFGRLF